MEPAQQSNARHKPRKDGLAKTTAKHAERARDGGEKSGGAQKRSAGVARLGKSKRSAQRNADRGHRKEVVPLAARDARVARVVVVVAGPPGSGKSTLIRSLVKLHTRHTLKTVLGSVFPRRASRAVSLDATVDLSRERDTLFPRARAPWPS